MPVYEGMPVKCTIPWGYEKPSLSPTVTFVITVILTLFVGVVDWAAEHELQLFVLYFLPITIAGMKCTPIKTYFVAVLSGFTWLVSDWLSGYSFNFVSYEIWNNIIKILSLIILSHSIVRIKILLDMERNLSNNLKIALSKVKTLEGLLPVCAWCKKIRNDEGYWQQIEEYISYHSNARITHGMCHECSDEFLKEGGSDPLDSKTETEIVSPMLAT